MSKFQKNQVILFFIIPFNTRVIHQFPVMPKTSEFFLFSSAMDHHVTRNLSNESRISVSFNLKIEDLTQ